MRVTSRLSRPSRLWALLAHARLAWRLLHDSRVPAALKMMPFAAALYVISPLDFVPDVFPIVGQLDDLGVILLALELFVRWCPADVVEFHRHAGSAGRGSSRQPAARPTVIDAEFRHDDRPR